MQKYNELSSTITNDNTNEDLQQLDEMTNSLLRIPETCTNCDQLKQEVNATNESIIKIQEEKANLEQSFKIASNKLKECLENFSHMESQYKQQI